MARSEPYDVVIIGGGFYGCCLALFLRSVTDNILVIEQDDNFLNRASRVNQARIHTGFHYPRSFVTALRSKQLQSRFARDFSSAVVDDFAMLYAIARRRSKVSAERFFRTFSNMQAPIARASASDAALFNPALIEAVFACDEFAFDWTALRTHLVERLYAQGIAVRLGTRVEAVEFVGDKAHLTLDQGESVSAGSVFNVTYAGINQLLENSGLAPLHLKHELAELALVEPPKELGGKGVTVMDGPFFSLMPYPSRGLYSLTHVRYTPHASWTNPSGAANVDAEHETRWRHMVMDATRYLPCSADAQYRESLYAEKTIRIQNESDDGRPILLHRHNDAPAFYSVMGGKLDNIYDLFELLPAIEPRFRTAHDGLVGGQ